MTRPIYRIIVGLFVVLAFLLTGVARYHAAAAPATVTPRFVLLKFGEVMPAGWIKAQMRREIRDGSPGHLDELAHQASSDIFGSGRNAPGKPNVAAEGGAEGVWWNGETEGNWRTGYIMTAYLSGDPDAMRKADASVAHILATQDADGYIGIYSPELRYTNTATSGEMWTEACIMRGLVAYYELTGKAEVLRAVERAMHVTMAAYGPGKWQPFAVPAGAGGIAHGLMITDVLARLYELTGNAEYRNFGVRLYHDFSSGNVNWISHDVTLKSLLDPDAPFIGHGATTMEHLRVPLWAYYATGDPVLGQAAEDGFRKLEDYVMPSGEVIGMEFMLGTKPDPTTTYCEFCTGKEELVSLINALQKTGNAKWGDLVEKLRFNGMQGMIAPGGKGVTYCTRDNRYAVSREVGGRDKFSPVHGDVAVCCNPNFSQSMATYVHAMWMRTPEDGLAAMLYGPSTVSTEVKGVPVRIAENTEYPFASTLTFAVAPERAVEFPLVFRNPHWSKNTQVHAEGATVSLEGDYFVVRKLWKKGDQVTLDFQESIRGVSASNGELALECGPLVYALQIPSVEHQSKAYALPGFADLEYSPAEGANWNYLLDASLGKSDFGFVAQPDPAANVTYPFDSAPIRLQGKLINLQTARRADVSLVPMGSSLAMLRRVTFPAVFPTDFHGRPMVVRAGERK